MKNNLLIIMMVVIAVTANANDPKIKKVATIASKENPDSTNRVPAKWEYEIENTFTNSYFWRGLVFNKGIMWQPNFTAAKGNWNMNAWSNVVAKEIDGNEICPEFDMSLYYKGEHKKLSYTPQLALYFYPSNYQNIITAEMSSEFIFKTEPIGFYFNPSIDLISNLNGCFIDYGFYRKDNLTKNLTLESKFLMSWGNKKFNDYYNPKVPVTESFIGVVQNVHQDYKSIRLAFKAEYKLRDNLYLRSQIIAFKNFMLGYNNDFKYIQFNGSLSLACDF